MAQGIVIHIEAGDERRTEFFGKDQIKLGTGADCDLTLEPPVEHQLADEERGVWLELRRDNGFYRVADFRQTLDLRFNNQPLTARTRLRDGDEIEIPSADVQLSFFNVNNNSTLTANANNRLSARSVRFIEEAALESTISPNKRDDAKVFLREFTRELIKEISWTTKLIALTIVVGTLGGLFYLGFAVSRELQRTREVIEGQADTIKKQQDALSKTGGQIDDLVKSNDDFKNQLSLAPSIRSDYGGGVCLIVGTYSLVDKKNGKQLRYPDPTFAAPETSEPTGAPAPTAQVSENGFAQTEEPPLTTEGYGTPAEFDFVGTGFHVGNGLIVTNRHVVQPWAESEQVKTMARLSGGHAKLKKLVVYFPGFPQPFPIKVRETATNQDLAVAALDPNMVFPEIPILPLDKGSDATAVGKNVVTMGYPSGPDRLLAMVDEKDARNIQSRYGQSLQSLVSFLAQDKRITPLLTTGSITDLDAKSISHDAKTAEGGSGAPLFGQSKRIIGVNFGVFTGNTAANMAVPIKFILPLLKRAGWTYADDAPPNENDKAKNDNQNGNSNAAAKQK